MAFTVGGLEALAKLVLYVLHERVWDQIGFGRLGGHSPVPSNSHSASEPDPPQAGPDSVTTCAPVRLRRT